MSQGSLTQQNMCRCKLSPVHFFIGIWISLLLLTAFSAAAQDQDEIRFVKAFFDKLQGKSIAANREYCGYFGLDKNDNFIATKPTRGQRDGCFAAEPPANMDIFASYHTHGAYHPEFDTEVSSVEDMRADADEGVDGYIATPGGRLWFIDTSKRVPKARLICGESCTVRDKDYEGSEVPKVRKTYTIRQLNQRG